MVQMEFIASFPFYITLISTLVMDTHQLDFCVQLQKKLTNPIRPPPLPCDSRYNCDPDDNAVFPSNKVGHAANNPRKRR